jgi:hypothetical protein
MTSKRVYILGAGSSKGHSKGIFPSLAEFFTTAKQLKLVVDPEVLNFAKKVTGKDLFSKKSAIDVEAFFTHIEIELERNSSPELLFIREHLHKLIQSVLLGLESKINKSQGEYCLLLSKLKLRPQDTVVTFNWDLLLDNVLERENILANICEDTLVGATSELYRRFVYKMSAWGERTLDYSAIESPYQEWKPELGYYLKAHGSIDWFYCSNDLCRASRKVFPVAEPAKKHHCGECHEPLGLLVIPPVINKAYRQHPLIREIWNIAAKELSVARELVVWGYSLPTTDFYATWLFRQARQSSLKTINLIDPYFIRKAKKTKDLRMTFVRRFYDIFRDLIPQKSVHIYDSFEDYYSDRNAVSKHKIGTSEIMKI